MFSSQLLVSLNSSLVIKKKIIMKIILEVNKYLFDLLSRLCAHISAACSCGESSLISPLRYLWERRSSRWSCDSSAYLVQPVGPVVDGNSDYKQRNAECCPCSAILLTKPELSHLKKTNMVEIRWKHLQIATVRNCLHFFLKMMLLFCRINK